MLKTFPVKGTKKIKIHSSDPISIDGRGSGNLVIDGPAFLWPNAGIGYYHVLIDFLADWLICKENFPEIKLYIVQLSPEFQERLKMYSRSHYELLEMLPVEQIIDLQDYEKITFNNVMFCSSEMNMLLTETLGLPKVGTTCGSTNPRFKEWHELAIKNLNLFFEPFKQPVLEGLKIFVSRREEHDKITNYLSLTDPEEIESQRMFYEERSIYRYIDPENEQKVEDYFKSLGYSVVNFADYSLVEQIAISSSANQMAGFHGAGMLNGIFMNPNANVIFLNTCNVNTFYHTELHQLQRKNVIEFPPRCELEPLLGEGYRHWFLDIDMMNNRPELRKYFKKYSAEDIISYPTEYPATIMML